MICFYLMHSVPAVYIYNMTDKVKNILKYRLDFCKIVAKSIVGSLRRMGCPRFPTSVEVRSTILRGSTTLSHRLRRCQLPCREHIEVKQICED